MKAKAAPKKPAAKKPAKKVKGAAKKPPVKKVKVVKPSVPKPAKPPTARQKLETEGLDSIISRMSGGESQRAIADSLDIDYGDFANWLAEDPQRSARAREARILSARHWDEKAEAVLTGADDDKPGSIAKARELASHYRWRAKCYAPREYGDKLDLTAAVTVQELSEEQLQAKANALADKLGLSISPVGMQKTRAKTSE